MPFPPRVMLCSYAVLMAALVLSHLFACALGYARDWVYIASVAVWVTLSYLVLLALAGAALLDARKEPQ